MKFIFQLLFSSVIVVSMTLNAWAYDPIIEMVLSKKIIGTLTPQKKAVVDFLHPQLAAFQLPGYQAEKKQRSTKMTHRAIPTTKEYSIINDPYRYHSQISVTDPQTGQELKRLSVGRRAMKLLPNVATQRLYVLCGGYFSSVWEINTVTDMVVRKFPVFSPQKGHEKTLAMWHPGDIALFPEGQTLAIGGTSLQLVDLRSGQLRQELNLPPGNLKITQMYPAARHLLRVSMMTPKGTPQMYLFHTKTLAFSPTGSGMRAFYPYRATFKTPTHQNYLSHHHLAFIGSKNNDYLYVLDLISKSVVGLIPLDFVADDLLVTADRQRLFVYHRAFGQISIVDLAKASSTRFSVVARHSDERFKSPPETPFYLAQDSMEVYLCNQQKKIASINIQTHYLRIGVKFQARPTRPDERVWVSNPGRQRLYVQQNKLFTEKFNPADRRSSNPQEIPLSNHIQSITLSQDQRLLYALDNKSQQIIAYDLVANAELYRLPTGKNPTGLFVAGNTLFTLSADEGNLSLIDTQHQQISQILPLDVGLFHPYIITLYDAKMAQFTYLELPRFLKQAALMAG